jgi:Fe2+ transport system protein FeoA
MQKPLLLQHVPLGSRVRVVDVQGTFRSRALELGVVPGVECTVIRKAPFGGAIELHTQTSSLAIRPADGLEVVVELMAKV